MPLSYYTKTQHNTAKTPESKKQQFKTIAIFFVFVVVSVSLCGFLPFSYVVVVVVISNIENNAQKKLAHYNNHKYLCNTVQFISISTCILYTFNIATSWHLMLSILCMHTYLPNLNHTPAIIYIALGSKHAYYFFFELAYPN